jgi:hypothetical protein
LLSQAYLPENNKREKLYMVEAVEIKELLREKATLITRWNKYELISASDQLLWLEKAKNISKHIAQVQLLINEYRDKCKG